MSPKPAKKPARGPSVAPASANTEPAELKYRVSRTKPYETNSTPIVAIRNASGTARPICAATAVPFSAIAAVGAMIASDSAIASTKRNSRRRPGVDSAGRVSVVIELPPPCVGVWREKRTLQGRTDVGVSAVAAVAAGAGGALLGEHDLAP